MIPSRRHRARPAFHTGRPATSLETRLALACTQRLNVSAATEPPAGVLGPGIELDPPKSPAKPLEVGPRGEPQRRTVPAPVPVMNGLAEHLATAGRPGPDALVFSDSDGGPLRASHFRRRVWAPAVKAAGLEGFTFHGLRHAAAGFMIQLGAHPRLIQQRLGHASVRTTMDVYGEVLPEVDDRLTTGLGDLLTGSRGLAAASGLNGEPGATGETLAVPGKDGGGGERIRTAGLYVANVAL